MPTAPSEGLAYAEEEHYHPEEQEDDHDEGPICRQHSRSRSTGTMSACSLAMTSKRSRGQADGACSLGELTQHMCVNNYALRSEVGVGCRSS